MVLMMLCLSTLWSSDTQSWQWPIDPSLGTTSSFGEYRGERFHMGLDFSTGGVEGKEIRPARDGHVFRVRASERGYGRAIYIRHNDGMVTVYAHLAAFSGPLLEAIEKAGKAPLASFGELALNLPVTQHDLIAYSGESGAGPPHLHFEVRDSANQPQDPLELGFPKLPHAPAQPVLDGLLWLPGDEQSQVEGQFLPYFSPKDRRTLRLSGKFGLQVRAYLAGPRGSKLGLRGLRIYLDDVQVASWEPEKLSFDEYRHAPLVFDQAHSGFGPTTFHYCFDDRAAFLPSVNGYESSFHQMDLSGKTSGQATLVIALKGQNQAWSRESFKLVFEKSATSASVNDAKNPKWRMPTTLNITPYRDRAWVRVNRLNGTLHLPNEMIGLAPGGTHTLATSNHQQPIEVIWRTEGGSLKRIVSSLPGKRQFKTTIGPYRLDGQGWPLKQATALTLEPSNPRQQVQELVYVAPVLQFGRQGLPAKTIQISYPKAAQQPHLGFYYWSFQRQRWRYRGGFDKQGNLRTRLNVLAPTVVAQDLLAPIVKTPKRHAYFNGSRIVIPVNDKGSGIDAASIRVTNTTGAVDFRYDSDRRWIILGKDARSPWTVQLADRAGRQTRVGNLRP